MEQLWFRALEQSYYQHVVLQTLSILVQYAAEEKGNYLIICALWWRFVREPQTGLQSQWNVNTSVLTERVCFPLEAFRIHLWFLIKLVTEIITCHAWFWFNYHFLHKTVSIFIFSKRAKIEWENLRVQLKSAGFPGFKKKKKNIIMINITLNMHWFCRISVSL